MEFHINSPQGNNGLSSNNDNDRLQKAIERNRAKQARRQSGSGNVMVGSPGDRFNSSRQASSPQSRLNSSVPNNWESPGQSQNSGMNTSSRFENIQNRFESMNSQSRPQAGVQRQRSATPSHARRTSTSSSLGQPMTHSQSGIGKSGIVSRGQTSRSSTVGTQATRRSVAGLNQEQEIIKTPAPKRKAAANIKYSTPKKTRKKKTKAASSTIKNLVKGAWVLCLVLLVRLVFTDGGIIDYYSTKSLLNLKVNELKSIKDENISLVNEIERIKSDKLYQKKLVRDNLGFIARNEYLVLFPKIRKDN